MKITIQEKQLDNEHEVTLILTLDDDTIEATYRSTLSKHTALKFALRRLASKLEDLDCPF